MSGGIARVARRLLVALTFSLVLSGCAVAGSGAPSPSPTSIVVETIADSSTVNPPLQGTTNALLDETVSPARLTLTGWGSAGCIPVPDSVTWNDPSTIELTTFTPTSSLCSAIYAPISQVIELPTGHSIGDVTTVNIDGESIWFTLKGEQ